MVPDVQSSVVAEPHEWDGIPKLPPQIQPVHDSHGAVAPAEGPNAVDRGIVECGLEVAQPVRVRPR
jgi:hypothetical protein